MNIYVAELDENCRIAAVWVRHHEARGPSLFDPRKHIFDPRPGDVFSGAPRDDVVKWIKSAKSKRMK
ncbi:MAG: hypothetical protein AAFQ54_14290 [Pseudomonadota bacterium]